MEQEIENLRESQVWQDPDFGDISLGKNHEMLETENNELVERLRVQLEDFYRLQEENTLLQKNVQGLTVQIKKTEDKLGAQKKLAEEGSHLAEVNKELALKIEKAQGEMESVRAES